jgi:hypothetical protein
MREMIDTCIRNDLKFSFVLVDSWFSATENFDFITGKGKHFIAALKGNRLIALTTEKGRPPWVCRHRQRTREIAFEISARNEGYGL